jgi:hypothetical protein
MKYFIYLLLLFMNVQVIAQKKQDKSSANKWFAHTLEASPKNKEYKVNLTQINGIQVQDRRFEKSSWGLIKNRDIVYKIIPSGSMNIQKSMQQYLDTKFTYNVATPYSLLAVIRHFCFSSERKKNDFEQYSKQPLWQAGVSVKIDFYLQKNNLYYPLYRFKEDYISNKKEPNENMNEILSDAIDLAFAKLIETDKTNLNIGAKAISAEMIEAVNQQAFQLPILLTDTLKKGVYQNFEELKNNKPSIADYKIEKNKVLSKLIVEKDGQTFPAKNIWGFCDGERIFIQCNNNFFELARQENSFFTMAAKNYSNKIRLNPGKLAAEMALVVLLPQGAYVVPNSLEVDKYYQNLKPYFLNMETGELY